MKARKVKITRPSKTSIPKWKKYKIKENQRLA